MHDRLSILRSGNMSFNKTDSYYFFFIVTLNNKQVILVSELCSFIKAFFLRHATKDHL